MLSNSVTLAQLIEMEQGQVNSLPLDLIEMLLEEVAEQKAVIKAADDKLFRTLDHRFAEKAAQARKEAGKDTGTVTIDIGDGRTVKADLPKRVSWNQDKLAEAETKLRNVWEEDPAEYIVIERKVAESKFTAWPKSIQALFTPARTVGTGKPSYELVRETAQ
jgi:hypothetical protein